MSSAAHDLRFPASRHRAQKKEEPAAQEDVRVLRQRILTMKAEMERELAVMKQRLEELEQKMDAKLEELEKHMRAQIERLRRELSAVQRIRWIDMTVEMPASRKP